MSSEKELVHFDQEDYALFLKTVAALPYLEKIPVKEETLREWYVNIMSAGTDSCGAPLYAGGWQNAVRHMGLGGSNMGTVLAWYRGDYNFFQSGQELYQQLRFEILPISDMAGLRLGKATEDLNRELFHEKYRAVSVENILDSVRDAHFDHNAALRVTPDDIVIMPDNGLYIVDYKTINRGKPAKDISNSYKAQLVQGLTVAELLGHHIAGGIISYLDITNMEAVAVSIDRKEMLTIRKEMDEARELFWGHLIAGERPPYRTPYKTQEPAFVEEDLQNAIQKVDWELAYYKTGKSLFEEAVQASQKTLEDLCLKANTENITKLNAVSLKEQLSPQSMAKVATLYPENFKDCKKEELSFSMSAEEFIKEYATVLPAEIMDRLIKKDIVYDSALAATICKEESITAEIMKITSTRMKQQKEIKNVCKEFEKILKKSLDETVQVVLEERQDLQTELDFQLENRKTTKKVQKK